MFRQSIGNKDNINVFYKMLVFFAFLFSSSIAISANTEEASKFGGAVPVESFDLKYIPSGTTNGSSTFTAQGKPLPKISGKKLSNGKYAIEGEGANTADGTCFSYEYKVDLKTKTYTLKPITNYGLDDSYLQLQAMDSKINPEGLKNTGIDFSFEQPAKDKGLCLANLRKGAVNAPVITPMVIMPGTRDVTVGLRTRDVPDWTITKTTDRLRWATYSNGTVQWLAWNVWWYAANPSPINTHWYVNQQNHSGPTYGFGSTNVTKSVYGSYYNYDWGYPSWATTVAQNVSIRGNNDGTYTYSWTHNDAGEDNGFIWGVITFY